MKDKLEFNEENQINLVVEKDGLKREIFYQGKPIQELIKYKDMWQKLKEWLEEDIQNKSDKLDFEFIRDEIGIERSVLYKMQELEGEDE